MLSTGSRRARLGAVMVSAALLGAAACSSSSSPSSAPTTAANAPSSTKASGAPTTVKLGDGAAAASGPATPTFTGKIDVGLDFKPEVNGFSFENYGKSPLPNLTADEVRRFFGDQACASVADGKCVLTPPAKEWTDSINDAMQGGHCEGMAALALLFMQGKVSLKDFGDASTANGLKLEGNEKLAKEIAYWWATQATTPLTSSRLVDLKPSEVVAKLKESFTPGAAEQYTFAFFKIKDGQKAEGHAVTPYGLQDKGNGVWDVPVYDNNFPNQARALTIDTTNEKWTYSTAINPSEPVAPYEGDATTKSLWLAPTSQRVVPQTCPFCAGSTSGAPAKFAGAQAAAGVDEAGRYTQVFLGQEAAQANVRVTITDLNGQPIPGAGAVDMVNGTNAEVPDIQQVPAGVPFRVTLDASKATGPVTTNVTMIGAATDQFIDDIHLEVGQVDTIELDPAKGSVSYETTSSESPTIGAGFSSPGADYAVAIGGVDLPGGGKVEMRMDQAAGKVYVVNHGKETGTYALAMERIDDKSDDLFSHDGVELGAGATLTLDYAQWDKGEKLKASVTPADGGAPQDIELDSTK
jgi:hypothetical protein